MLVRGYDFHCHVDLYPDPPAMIASCEEKKVFTLAVTTTPRAWPQNRRWSSESLYVQPAVGLHPEVVAERHGEVELLEEYMKDTPLVGEVGLDGSPQHRKSWQMQRTVFIRALIEAQRLGGRIVSLHSRQAAGEVVQALGEHTTADRLLPILHWFSGSIADARKAVALGCYFSINQATLTHASGLALVRSLPEGRLLTETDGPFTSTGDRKNEPADVLTMIGKLADARGLSEEELERILTTNAQRVLSFAGLKINSV